MCNDGWRTAQDGSTYPCTHCEPPFEERLRGELMTKFLHDAYGVNRPARHPVRSPLRSLMEAHLDFAGWRNEGDAWVKEPYRLTFDDAVARQIAEECSDDPPVVFDPWPSSHGYDVAFDHPKVAAILKRHLVEAEALGQILRALRADRFPWLTPERRLDAIRLLLDDVFDPAPLLTLPPALCPEGNVDDSEFADADV
jgi:hypothetical protein